MKFNLRQYPDMEPVMPGERVTIKWTNFSLVDGAKLFSTTGQEFEWDGGEWIEVSKPEAK